MKGSHCRNTHELNTISVPFQSKSKKEKFPVCFGELPNCKNRLPVNGPDVEMCDDSISLACAFTSHYTFQQELDSLLSLGIKTTNVFTSLLSSHF